MTARPLSPFVLLLSALLMAGCSDHASSTDASLADGVRTAPAVTAFGEPANTLAPGMATSPAQSRRTPDVVYVPTPEHVVEAMLKLGEVRPGDVLYDLGSGDGRIPIAAARKFGVRGTGIEIDPVRIREANANAREAGVAGLVTFREEDLFEADFSEATVVTLYLLDSLNERLRPKLLAELKPGTRIVSHDFRMGDWQPEQTVEIPPSTIYRWTIPEKSDRNRDQSGLSPTP